MGAAVEPLFLDGPAGRIFAVYHAPVGQRRGGLVYVPPFAEEMNRSRRMATLQARSLAASGMGILLLDLFGTGDSAGDFEDARWPLGLGDVAAAATWLEAKAGAPVGLWGLRLGALLAATAAATQPGRFNKLLFWQPVTDGKAMLTQFLRIRVAASMAESTGEKTEELRARLVGGEPVEVAGYALSNDLAEALDAARMDKLRLPPAIPVHWFEVAAEPSERLLPAGQRVVEAWRHAGSPVTARTVPGDPFWTLQETTLAPELLAATTQAVETWPT